MNTKQNALVADGSGEMFDRIARRYDLLNRINSLGLDAGWRRKMIRALKIGEGHRALDLATGTGDVALMLARAGASVLGIDPAEQMLVVGREKAMRAGLSARVSLLKGDAQQLGEYTGQFDRASMAFGIRNVPDRALALAQIVAALKPGGLVAILELSVPERGLLAFGAQLHMRYMVPFVGKLLSAGEAYDYLRTSIEAFPKPEDFAKMLRQAGLQDVRIEPMTFGAAHLYVGRKS